MQTKKERKRVDDAYEKGTRESIVQVKNNAIGKPPKTIEYMGVPLCRGCESMSESAADKKILERIRKRSKNLCWAGWTPRTLAINTLNLLEELLSEHPKENLSDDDIEIAAKLYIDLGKYLLQERANVK